MNRRAFTLIELLVVISIVAMLVAILLPALQKARKAVMTTQCLSNQRQHFLPLSQYIDDHRGYIPPTTSNWAGNPSSDPVNNPAGVSVGWAFRLTNLGYLPRISQDTTLRADGVRHFRLCPEAQAFDSGPVDALGKSHYVMLMEVTGSSNTQGASWVLTPPRKLPSILQPSITMALSEVQFSTSALGVRSFYSVGTSMDVTDVYRWRLGHNGLTPVATVYTKAPEDSHRHNRDSVNFTFFDGHAETRKFRSPDMEASSYNVSPTSAQMTAAQNAGGFGKIIGRLDNRRIDGH